MVPHTELFANYFLPILDALAKKNIIPGRYAVRLFIFSMERRRQQEIQQLRKKSGKTVLEGEGVKTIEKCKKDSWTRPLQFVLHIYIHSVSSIVQAGWLTDRNSFTLFACLFFPLPDAFEFFYCCSIAHKSVQVTHGFGSISDTSVARAAANTADVWQCIHQRVAHNNN